MFWLYVEMRANVVLFKDYFVMLITSLCR